MLSTYILFDYQRIDNYWSDKKSRFVLIGPLLIQLIVFSYAVTLEVKNVSIGILDKDGGGPLMNLSTLQGIANFAKVHYLRGFQEIRPALDSQEVQFVIQIPEDFSRRWKQARPLNSIHP